jgi:hypothetical protein
MTLFYLSGTILKQVADYESDKFRVIALRCCNSITSNGRLHRREVQTSEGLSELWQRTNER